MLMGPQAAELAGRKCLALDLDETLVHSSFQPVKAADYVIPVQIEGAVHNVYVLKRPGVDEFLRRVSQSYEVVVYTASLGKYADPLLDLLDTDKSISGRFFREDCVFHDGHYVKDLSLLNRDINTCIIVDNSPMSYIFHPENAIDCSSFIDSPADRELWQIADFLEEHKAVSDTRTVCRTWREWCRKHSRSAPSP
jgi:RNA polymerase II subunit A small phosphatase-like protein